MKTSLYLKELCEISETLSATPKIEKLLTQILSASLKVSGADEGSLMLLDEKSNVLRVKVGLGLPQEVYNKTIIKLGEPVAGLVAKSGMPLLLDSRAKKGIQTISIFGTKRGIKSSLCLPLKVMDKTIGVLNLNIIKDNRCFTKHDKSLLSVFATVAAISLEHAGLYSTTKQHIEEMLLLNKLGESLGIIFSFDEILNLVVKTIQEVVEMDIFSLAFLDDERQLKIKVISNRLLCSTTKNYLKSEILKVMSDLTGIDVTISANECDFSIEIKEPLLASSADEKEQLLSEFTLPLVAKSSIIGLIRISSFSKDKFSENNIRFLATMSPQVAIALENAKMYAGMQELYTGTIQALSAELETRNPYTMGHSERVTKYAVQIARAINLSEDEVETIRYAGLFHDMGKIGIADSVLLKQGPLIDEEWEEIKKHPVKSEGIVKFVSFLKGALPIIRYHHERFDGKGYPDGKLNNHIPIGARIIAVADTFDAITSDRPYREKRSVKEALNIIKKCSGTQFDPTIVSAFLQIVKEDE